MRTFFAFIPPPEAVLAIDKWRAINWPLLERPVSPENLHLTLLFSGDINRKQLQCLHDAVRKMAEPAIDLEFNCTGFFNKADILWLGMQNPPIQLIALVTALKSVCRQCDIGIEKREYVPHITLARRCAQLPGLPLIEPAFRFLADCLYLMCSEKIGGKVIYRPLLSRRLMSHDERQ